ncbi:MAG: hypothetical protein SAJ37_12555 [Oscillatoria sp. PMC 1068.18]|nr:hypothetical protein [Oscillatoria sp. PMC 1076.18]MEC4989574.1 hypothetical protein [Oscillatoria sp. PMC 1068.18]
MNQEKITCPVCDRPNIEGDVCPNCETNLSFVRMLIELPTEAQKSFSFPGNFWRSYLEKITNFNWLAVGLTIILITIGIGLLGVTANFFFSRQMPLLPQTSSVSLRLLVGFVSSQVKMIPKVKQTFGVISA